MSKLTSKQRESLPKSDFVFPEKAPGHGSYPINDKTHARVAKSYASKEEHAGKMSKAAEEKVDRKADKELGEHTHVKSHKRTVSKKTVTVKAHKRRRHTKHKN